MTLFFASLQPFEIQVIVLTTRSSNTIRCLRACKNDLNTIQLEGFFGPRVSVPGHTKFDIPVTENR